MSSLPCIHVLSRHDEHALRADPFLRGRVSLHLDALEVEHPGARLAADHVALLVADPAETIVGCILKFEFELTQGLCKAGQSLMLIGAVLSES